MTVTLYGTDTCPPCKATESWLKSRNIPYQKHNVHTDPEAMKHVESVGIKTLPVVEIVMGKLKDTWGGFQPQRLRKLVG